LPLKTIIEKVSEEELREKGVLVEQTTRPSIVVDTPEFSDEELSGSQE
jgi:hypothetical protein